MTDIPPIPGKTITRPKRTKWWTDLILAEEVPTENVPGKAKVLRVNVDSILDDMETTLKSLPPGIQRNIFVRIDLVLGDPHYPEETVSWLPVKEK